ncbi:hypothetical protein BDV98DRAFT_555040 [Pterulicium gracile]|uniref:Ubiquitin 3 binding protein But2 C-terminal domain-containing protein n=1 Tax=Pterulicium gracile TaxID=1884261 RepID=A0A5C3QDS1_9AGAR|nr:hypothetical protein BDV98DRAFT_555040 [Pterula gracilis]
MNLERVYQKGSSPAHPKFPSFYTFPHVVMQIDAADPKRAFLPEKHRSYSSEQGFIYSDDRFFEASAKRSTIVQFRNQDFGMENCTLQPTIPLDSSTTDFDPAAQFLLSSTIDIWMLDNSREISRHDLWDRAPPRKHLFTQITIDGKGCKECHLRYPCPSASFSTFEFACSSESVDCLVNFWQRKRTSPNGESNHSGY